MLSSNPSSTSSSADVSFNKSPLVSFESPVLTLFQNIFFPATACINPETYCLLIIMLPSPSLSFISPGLCSTPNPIVIFTFLHFYYFLFLIYVSIGDIMVVLGVDNSYPYWWKLLFDRATVDFFWRNPERYPQYGNIISKRVEFDCSLY